MAKGDTLKDVSPFLIGIFYLFPSLIYQKSLALYHSFVQYAGDKNIN